MLIETLLESAEKYPDREAIADQLGTSLTYSRFVRLATVMKGYVEKGTKAPRVGIFLPSCAGFVMTFYGTLWANKVPVPLNLLLHPDEVMKIVKDAGLDLIVTLRFPEAVAHFNDTVDQLPCQKIYLGDLPLKRKFITSHFWPQPRVPKFDPDDVATLLYTSGTSGDPKGVMLTHRNLVDNAKGCIELLRPGPDRRFLGVLPLFHSFGLTSMMVVPLVLGSNVYYMPRFVPAQVIRTIEQRRITMVFAIASMYTALMHVKSAKPDTFKLVELPISGGEALPPKLYKDWLDRFGTPLLEGYGLTETSPVVSVNPPWANRGGTAGQLLAGVEARTVDDDGRPLPPETVGEIMIRGSLIMKGYYNKPQETAAVIDSDGWFRSGDMGRVSADRYVTITGRKKEMIIVSGENVYPREIESVLEQHPAVAESAVISEKVGGTRGEVPVGFVILREGQTATDTELREFCRHRLPQYKIPRVIWFAEQLPRGPTGKILKRALDPSGPPKPSGASGISR